MKLVIHDLTPEEWRRYGQAFDGWRVISDNGSIRPCVGCFACWNKTPGQCIVKDGYEETGALFHRADEVTVISRYTCGGFSGFVKNVFDRCLGYALPHFEVVDGETHHRKRYDEDKPFSFVFYGHGLSDAEKESARRYVKAVCANVRCHIRDIRFRECADGVPHARRASSVGRGKVVFMNGSLRAVNGNTARLAARLAGMLERESETVAIGQYLSDLPALMDRLEGASDIVICTPLYLDGLPSQVIRLMETMERRYRGSAKRIYVLANMGLYESRQLVNLFDAVRQWCDHMAFPYCGGLGVSAGELIGVLMRYLPFRIGFTGHVAHGMKRLASAIDGFGAVDDIYAEPCCFPRWLYIRIANDGWKKSARANGIREADLYRQL